MIEQLLLDDTLLQLRKLKAQADKAVAQIKAEDFFAVLGPEDNSIALIMKHVAGNMRSRWTDFLTSDGEKPDRNRDSEFEIEPHEYPGAGSETMGGRLGTGARAPFSPAARGSAANRDRSGRGTHGAGSNQSAVDSLRGACRADRPAQQALRGRPVAVAEYSTRTFTRRRRLQERLDLRSAEVERLTRSILLSGPVQEKRQGHAPNPCVRRPSGTVRQA